MPPEMKTKEYDMKVDIFGLGKSMVELFDELLRPNDTSKEIIMRNEKNSKFS